VETKRWSRLPAFLFLLALAVSSTSCTKTGGSAASPSDGGTVQTNSSDEEVSRNIVSGSDSVVDLISTSSLKVTLLKSWFAQSGNCSAPTGEFNYLGATFDFIKDAKLFGASDISPSTDYGCFALQVEDKASWIPSASMLGCEAGKVYEKDLCPEGTTATNVDGSTFACTSGVDAVTLFFSNYLTYDSNSATNPFTPPSDVGAGGNGLNLQWPVSLSASPTQQGYLAYTVGRNILATSDSCTLEVLPRAVFIAKP